MSDQISKFPDAAKLVAQTMCNRWDACFHSGFKHVVGKLYKSTSEIEDMLGRALYCDDESSKEDDSAYKLHLLYDDPGSVAFVEIEWVGIFQLSKQPELPFPKNQGINEKLCFVICHIINDDDTFFDNISYSEYVHELSFTERCEIVKFVEKHYNLFILYNGIPFHEDYNYYDNIDHPGKAALNKLINLQEQ